MDNLQENVNCTTICCDNYIKSMNYCYFNKNKTPDEWNKCYNENYNLYEECKKKCKTPKK